MNNDKILITTESHDNPKPGMPSVTYAARIDGIAACGTGHNEEEAVRSLCNLLGDFVKGHAATIAEMRDGMRRLAEPRPPTAEEIVAP